MKEEIERRRAEAAEKRQKVEDTVDGEERPFKCVSPRGSSLKVGLPFLTSRFQQCFICKSTVCYASCFVVIVSLYVFNPQYDNMVELPLNIGRILFFKTLGP